jgi:2,4-dienoyl-CoA reductase-like NADH-dependent reductase (Old Yellow Enzyme family)
MHLAPRGDAHGVGDSDLSAVFHHVAGELGKRGIAFICARESFDQPPLGPSLKQAFGGVYIANESFTADSARKALQSGMADAVAFGKSAIANPDLVDRFKSGAPLNPPDPSTFYGDGPVGYVDYPFLETTNV